ncbi:MAG: hypothetical protein KDA89_11785, partial [Planctomycetaceae bacterium]|nr:hypothetical protein [Planctomycetaceae bacterium]
GQVQFHPFHEGAPNPSENASPFSTPQILAENTIGSPDLHLSCSNAGRVAWLTGPGNVHVESFGTDAVVEFGCSPQASFLCLSPDGRHVVVVDSNSSARTVTIFDAETGDRRHVFPIPGGYVRTFYSPDSRLLVMNVLNEYQVRDATSGSLLHTIPRESGLMGAAAWTTDGSLLALACGDVRLFDAHTFAPVATLHAPVPQSICTSLALTPDGSRLFASFETREIHCWDLESIRRQLAELNLDW